MTWQVELHELCKSKGYNYYLEWSENADEFHLEVWDTFAPHTPVLFVKKFSGWDTLPDYVRLAINEWRFILPSDPVGDAKVKP